MPDIQTTAIPVLDILQVTLPLQPQPGAQLRPAAEWRSAMGLHLRRALCITGLDQCSSCPMRKRCDYAAIMEPVPIDQMPAQGGSNEAPRPYILQSHGPSAWNPDHEHSVHLSLLGQRAHTFLPPMISALQRAAETGVGPSSKPSRYGTGTLRLQTPESTPDAHVPVQQLTVQLESPLSLRIQGQYLRPDTLRFRHFFGALLRRINQLSAQYQQPTSSENARAILDSADAVQLSADQLRWHAQERWSARQNNTVNTSGMTGMFQLKGDLDPFMPWLLVGQHTHVGKNTVMGMGRYRLEPDAP